MITFATDISQQCQWYARRANRNQVLLTCLQSGGAAFNLTSYTATFKVWVYGAESTPVISLTQGAGITNGNAAGTLLLDITEAQSTLTPNIYLMKLEITYPDSTVRTWINGSWILNGDLYDGGGSSTSVTVSLNATGTPVTLTINHPGAADVVQQTLTDGATINWDVSIGDYAKVTLGGNRTVANPTNTINGRFYVLEVIQDGTGSRTLSWGSNFVWSGGTAPTLTSTINKRDFIGFICSNGKLYGNSVLNFA